MHHTGPRLGLEPSLAILTAREACREVILSSFALADVGRRASMADLFVENGVQCIDGNVVQGLEKIREALAARDAIPGRRTAHVVTQVLFEESSPSEIVARSFLLLYLLTGEDTVSAEPNALAGVEDHLVRVSGAWRFSSRTITTQVGRC